MLFFSLRLLANLDVDLFARHGVDGAVGCNGRGCDLGLIAAATELDARSRTVDIANDVDLLAARLLAGDVQR